ncbi:hypothetical protein Tco_0602323 [Tanacetum coccineum]
MPIFKRTFSQDLDLLEQHLTKEIISQTDCKTILTKLRTTFENAFNSEFKERMQKYTRFDVQSFKDAMICNMDSIGNYMLEIILHQQRTPQLLKQKKLIQDADTFTSTMLLNVDQLQKQLDKDGFQEDGSMAAFWVYDRRVNKRQLQTQDSKIDTGKAVDADLVVTKSSGTESEVQDESSRSGNDTDADDADIRPIYDEEQWLRVDQYLEQCQVKSPMLDSSPDNQTTDYSKQSLESENILLKKTVAQFQKDFSRMEAHCIALELKYHNQALKSGQHGQILNEISNKAKIKKEIDVLETMNIELEHSVTKLPQIQEKVFLIAALKNELRKLKGNSVDTKFAQTSVLGKPVLQSLRNQLFVRQSNAFKSESPQMSKPWYASQVDGYNNFSRPVTQHYLPKRRESVFEKPDHMIASSESRNSSKNMPRFNSNDMVHNHYLDEARKKKHERDRNSKTSVMHSARFQSTADGSKPKSRSNNQTPRSLPVSKSSCVRITIVYEKTSPRSDLRWNPTGRIFKYVGLRCIPTGKLFDSCTSKDDSEPTHGSNMDIPNIHENKQTLDLSEGTSINVQKEQGFDLSAEGNLGRVANKSFASVMGAQSVRQVVTISELRNEEVVEGATIALPLAAVDAVNARREAVKKPGRSLMRALLLKYRCVKELMEPIVLHSVGEDRRSPKEVCYRLVVPDVSKVSKVLCTADDGFA